MKTFLKAAAGISMIGLVILGIKVLWEDIRSSVKKYKH